MNLSEVLQNENSLIVVRSGDLQEFAKVLVSQYQNQERSETPVRSSAPISQGEAMKRLNRSRQTFVSWRKKGILKGFLIGGRVFFDPDDLDNLQRIKRG